jgi:hypothetical protein
MCTARVAVLMASFLALAIGTTAPARTDAHLSLRPGVGVGTLRVGTSFAGVRKTLGKPSRIAHRRDWGFGSYAEYEWGWASDWIVGVQRQGSRATVVMLSTSRPFRTVSGVGTGSSLRSLQRRLGARCYYPSPPPKGPKELSGYPLQAFCYLGRRGGAITLFSLANHCAVPNDRHSLCPKSKRRYRVYEVCGFGVRSCNPTADVASQDLTPALRRLNVVPRVLPARRG